MYRTANEAKKGILFAFSQYLMSKINDDDKITALQASAAALIEDEDALTGHNEKWEVLSTIMGSIAESGKSLSALLLSLKTQENIIGISALFSRMSQSIQAKFASDKPLKFMLDMIDSQLYSTASSIDAEKAAILATPAMTAPSLDTSRPPLLMLRNKLLDGYVLLCNKIDQNGIVPLASTTTDECNVRKLEGIVEFLKATALEDMGSAAYLEAFNKIQLIFDSKLGPAPSTYGFEPMTELLDDYSGETTLERHIGLTTPSAPSIKRLQPPTSISAASNDEHIKEVKLTCHRYLKYFNNLMLSISHPQASLYLHLDSIPKASSAMGGYMIDLQRIASAIPAHGTSPISNELYSKLLALAQKCISDLEQQLAEVTNSAKSTEGLPDAAVTGVPSDRDLLKLTSIGPMMQSLAASTSHNTNLKLLAKENERLQRQLDATEKLLDNGVKDALHACLAAYSTEDGKARLQEQLSEANLKKADETVGALLIALFKSEKGSREVSAQLAHTQERLIQSQKEIAAQAAEIAELRQQLEELATANMELTAQTKAGHSASTGSLSSTSTVLFPDDPASAHSAAISEMISPS